MDMRLCAFLVAILITVTSTAQTPLQEDLKLARKYFTLQEFNQSRIIYESVEEQSPLETDDLRRLARAYEAVGDRELAIEVGQKVFESSTTINADLLFVAELLKKEARYDEALFVLENYAQRGGENARLHLDNIEFAKNVLAYEKNCDLENLAYNTSSAESGVTFYQGDMVYATHRVNLNGRFNIKGNLDDRPKSVLMQVDADDVEKPSKPIKIQDREGDEFGFASYSADGRMMVYVKSDFKPEAAGLSHTKENMALYYARTTESGVWQEDKAFPYNSTQFANGFPYLSEDGATLFYASNKPEGLGGFDLYMSQYENGQWSQPINLGEDVNTPGNEITPFVSDKKLYFASDYLPGLGGYDVYSIRNVENNWIDLSHMGACVNSPEDDYGFIVDPKKESAYFTSTRLGGKGHDDLYKINDANSISEIDIVQPSLSSLPNVAEEPAFASKSVVNTEVYIPELELISELEMSTTKFLISDNDLESKIWSEDLMKSANVNDIPTEFIDADEAAIAEVENLESSRIVISETIESVDAIETNEVVESSEVESGLVWSSFKLFEDLILSTHNSIGDDIAWEEPIAEDVDELDAQGVLIMEDSHLSERDLVRYEKVYFIQIAALSRYKGNLNRFDHFKRFGNVYKMQSGGVVKIRLGYYQTQAEALKVLKVLKEKGIREAFIVGDVLDANRLELISARTDQGADPSDSWVPAYRSSYKVQVAAYHHPSRFQTSQISDLGRIEHWTKGEWKIIVLSGFSKLEQAEHARKQCRKRGYKDAFIVKEKNGELLRVK